MSSSVLGVIPLEPEQISRDWLFEVINQFRRCRQLPLVASPADITNCTIDERQNSNGYFSTTYKLQADFQFRASASSSNQEAHYTFFLKMLPGVEEKHRKLVKETRVFAKEVEAQFDLLPQLRAFVAASGVRGIELPTPEIVYGSYNEGGAGIVVLMDLNEEGFYPINHYNGFSSTQLTRIVEKIATFHACGTAMILQESSPEKRFKLFRDRPRDNELAYNTLTPFYRDLSRFLRRVPGFTHVSLKVEQLRPQMVAMLARAEKRSPKFPLVTVLHGELCEKNILLRSDSAQLDVVLCDWKNACLGPPSHDLAFLLLSCADLSLKQHVLDKYYSVYTACLERLGVRLSEMRPQPTFKDFKEDFEEALAGAFLRVAAVLTREIKYLEVEFFNAKEDSYLRSVGEGLRALGGRLVDNADRFVPKLEPAKNVKNLDRLMAESRSEAKTHLLSADDQGKDKKTRS